MLTLLELGGVEREPNGTYDGKFRLTLALEGEALPVSF
jgi:hypothetical protein